MNKQKTKHKLASWKWRMIPQYPHSFLYTLQFYYSDLSHRLVSKNKCTLHSNVAQLMENFYLKIINGSFSFM